MKNKQSIDQESNGINRRSFIAKTIFAGAGLAALAASQNDVSAQTGGEGTQRTGEKLASDPLPGRRRLGNLEVSSVGLGVQNMSRTAWHSHPLGQVLIVTGGVGRVQRWGDAIDEIKQGQEPNGMVGPRKAQISVVTIHKRKPTSG